MSEAESQPNTGLGAYAKDIWKRIKHLANGNRDSEKKPRVGLHEPPRVRVVNVNTSTTSNTLVNPIENVHAANVFIDTIRDPRRGLEIDPRGYFQLSTILTLASGRYFMPLAIYVSDAHARLVLRSPQNERGRLVLSVYDPMIGGITEIEHPSSLPLNARLFPNALAEGEINSGNYDITYFNDPTLSRYRDSFLLNGKFAPLQRDARNCIPYCLFVGAMLQALKPGETKFKSAGIAQIQQDFGVRILTREEITKVRPITH